MIKTETKNGIVHNYSDQGRKIHPKGRTLPLANNAFEEVGKEHEWEEVAEE